MEAWIPLFDIFLKSPLPESEASLWIQRSFGASTTIPTTTASFVSLLMKPLDAIDVDLEGPPSSSAPIPTKRVMYIQTLPNMVQARIFSFLTMERQKFCSRDLCRLARSVLSRDQPLDFWVERTARNLFDVLCETSYEWISCLDLDSVEEEIVEEDFESVPGWLQDSCGAPDLVPWLPVSHDYLMSSRMSFVESAKNVDGSCEERGQVDELMAEVEVEIIPPTSDPLGQELLDAVSSVRQRLMSIESTSKTKDLAREIRKLCCDGKSVDSLAVLGLIEPWLVDDETASILMTHLSNESEEEEGLDWPSQVLCSTILPKLLVLEEPASRVLLVATTDFCKLHQKAAEQGLLLPLILRKDGINNPICDVITKIVKECLHTAHVSALCQKLLCGGREERRIFCLPCHSCLVSNELVWTQSSFTLFQNILNHNVCLTQDSVDHIVYQVRHLAENFSKSLKFGNFLLCLVTKCSSVLKSHKLTLVEAVERTKTLVTKSTLSKLASI